MDCSTPGFSVLPHLLDLAKIHVHWADDAIQPSYPVIPISSCHQSFPASGSFLMSQLFALGGQSIGASTSASIPVMNIKDWFPSGLTGLISLLSKGLLRVFSNTTVWKHQLFSTQPSSRTTLTSIHDYWINHSFDYMDFVRKVMSLLFNMLPSFNIAFLPRSKCLLISWLQSPSAVILEPKKIKSVTVSISRQILNPWTTRKSITFLFSNSSLSLHPCQPHHRSYPWESRHAEDNHLHGNQRWCSWHVYKRMYPSL